MSNDNQNNNETTADLLKEIAKGATKAAAISAVAQVGTLAIFAGIGFGIIKFQERKAKKNADK